MDKLLRPAHGLIRRYASTVERLLTAATLAGLLLYLLRGLPAYPPNWDFVLAGAVFGATLAAPPLGYFLAVLAAVYPLYHLSIYLMALFLAVALLGQRWFINNLGGTLLALATPLLSAVYLPWAVPVLGGLGWGPLGGALIGGLAAFWSLLLAGMTQAPLDPLARLSGSASLPDLLRLVERFTRIDSFDTLWRLAEPFVPDSNRLLFYLLQIGLWAGVGALVGALVESPWAQRRRPLRSLLIGWLGLLLLPGLTLASGLWLGLYPAAALPLSPRALGLALLLPGVLIALVEIGRNLMEYPLAFSAGRAAGRAGGRAGGRARPARPAPPAAPAPAGAAPRPTPPTAPPDDDEEEDDDLVRLEID